jgi:RNA polymerase sigma-70 factor (ECF subfamily)
METLTTLDGQLLQRAREYDAQALAEIYDRYAAPVYRYLCRYVGDAACAEDLTSEVFVRLLQVINTSRAPRDKLQGWLYRVAHNLAMDWFRQQSKGLTVTLDEELAVTGGSASSTVEKWETEERLRTAIRQLTLDQQQVVLLRFGEGLTVAQVGQLLGKSDGAVKILQHRAVKRLRKLLQSEER